ncbi:PTS IIA-like nitrogen-regulatory protein PtsN [Candidatus Electronema halotolerans]
MTELTEEGIILELQARTKEELLHEMAAAAQRQCPQIAVEIVRQALLEREQIGSTGVGGGIAIPHGKLSGLPNLLLCFGRSVRGIPFEAKDKLPVHLFVMILSPADMASEYLQTLGRISRLLKDESTRGKLLQAASVKTVQQLFSRTA